MLTPEQIKQYRSHYNIKPTGLVIPSKEERKASFLERAGGVVKKAGEGVYDAITGQGESAGKSPITRGFEAAAQGANAVVGVGLDAATSLADTFLPGKPVKKSLEVVGEGFKKGFDFVTNKLSTLPAYQEYARQYPEASKSPALIKAFEEALETAGSAGEIAGDILVADQVTKLGNTSVNTLKNKFKKPDANGASAFHGSSDGKLSIDENGNINLGTQKGDVVQFGGVKEVPLKNLRIKDFSTKAEMFDAAVKNKQALLKQGIDVVRAENHAISINPEKLSKVTGIPLAERFLDKTIKSGKNIASDILPTKEGTISREVTRALELTQGDVKNIKLSTGNEVGKFLAEKNLIGDTVEATVKNIDDFYKQNYEAVRNEIKNVKATYDPLEIPRYKEALTEIQKQIDSVPGLQTANSEVKALLQKSKPTLKDVQRVKELMDEHFSLYKATGDVKESIAKEGLSIIRKDIKEWIEGEVKDRSGVDIRELNNNVQTARSLNDAIETRATRGQTRATFTAGDIVTYLAGSGGGFISPPTGIIALLVKKLYDSPSFKLRFSKWLDKKSDIQRARIMEDLQKGKTPKEIKLDHKSPENNLSMKPQTTKKGTIITSMNRSNADEDNDFFIV